VSGLLDDCRKELTYGSDLSGDEDEEETVKIKSMKGKREKAASYVIST
jgi:hypothetical protein